MLSTIRIIEKAQHPSGQIRTIVKNSEEGWAKEVHTLSMTYLTCLLLSFYRERTRSYANLDRIIKGCLDFLENQAYRDPIEGYIVWHFNCFYPPDWEETCWCSLLLYEAKRLNRKQLLPLHNLLKANESSNYGVGVWIRDNFSKGNGRLNAYDIIAALSVQEWLARVFQAQSAPTSTFLQQSIQDGAPSLYYTTDFAQCLLSFFGLAQSPTVHPPIDTAIFHHNRRKSVQYHSPAVWAASQLVS